MTYTKQKLIIKYFGASHIGMIRSENQDSFGKFPENSLDLYSDKGQLFIVADGVGGHTGGREASSTAVETIGEVFFSMATDDPAAALKKSVEEGNLAIYKKAGGSREFVGMATTCTALLLKDEFGIVANVGDSRVYKIQNHKLEQITEDHTKVLEMLKEGILTKEEAANYPGKSVLARALGVEEKVKVDIFKNISLRAGQYFVLCSDGLAKVTPEEILEIVTFNMPEEACGKLIQLANDRGGKDNVTVEIIKIDEEKKKAEPIAAPEKRKNKWMIFVLIIVLFLFIGFMFRDYLPFFNSPKNINKKDDVSSNNQEVNSPEVNSENDSINRANNLFNRGRLDDALIIYKKILNENPMHLQALKGVNKIAESYLEKADYFIEENNFPEALKYYRIIAELQPNNDKARKQIQISEYRIKYGEAAHDSLLAEANIQSIAVSNRIVISKFNSNDWAFINTEINQYEINEKEIKFYGTSVEKKSLFNLNLNDVTVSADINLYSSSGENGAGIIAGYHPPGSENGESYFLCKIEENNRYDLFKFSNNKFEHLFSAESKSLKKRNINLKLKSSAKEIIFFEDNVQLGAWTDSKTIFGKIGFYADKNVLVKFSNININGSN